MHAEKLGLAREHDVSLLAQFLRERIEQRLAGINPTARHVPAPHIGMPHEEDAPFPIEHHAPHAQRHAARDPRRKQEQLLRHAKEREGGESAAGGCMSVIVGRPAAGCSRRLDVASAKALDPPTAARETGRASRKVLHRLSFLLGHLSDPHVGPVLRPRWRELAGKRFTGYINWRRGRHLIHDMAMLERITADLLAQKPDHVALTGDLVNIGLESEFVTAQRYIERVGGADFVSVIPGNHDVYVRSSFKYFVASAAPWMTGDDTTKVAFPYVRMRGGVALIGLSSGVPTAPLLASGNAARRSSGR